jgi:hypothetical protein
MNKISDDIQEGLNDFNKKIDVLKIHRRYIYIIVGLVTLLMCSILFIKCEHQKETDLLIKNIATYSDSAKHYKSKYGVVAFNQTLQFQNEKQLKAYFSQNDTLKKLLKNFKKINSVTIIKEKIFIHDTVPIPFESVIPCDFQPFTVKRDCTHYHFRGTIFPDKFNIDEISIPNKQTVVLGEKKTGFMKKEYRVEITNSNPFIQTSNVGGYTVNPKKEWYQKPFVTFLIGTGVGSAVSTAINLKK